jgi:DnaJ-class molecular chaperone
VSSRDYYDVLGVKRSANADELRAAYRKLARQFHPDVNKSPDAQKKFAEVQQAYDVLGDADRRRAYDQLGADAPRNGTGRPGASRPGPTWPGGMGGGARGPFDVESEDLGSVFDAIFGVQGRADGPRPGARRAPHPRSDDVPEEMIQEVRVDFLTAAKGGTASLRLEEASGQQRTVDVKISAGTEDGSQLRVRGAVRSSSGRESDLYLRVRTLPHELWRRGEHADTGKGLDLFLDLPLSISESTLGATIEVPTLTGKVSLTIPPGTASGRKLRMRGQGIRTEEGKFGDLVAIAQVVTPNPANLSELEKDVLRRIAESGGNPRAGAAWRRA